jgi:hypothetical protein
MAEQNLLIRLMAFGAWLRLTGSVQRLRHKGLSQARATIARYFRGSHDDYF